MLDVNRKTGKFDRKVWPNKFPRPLLIYALTLSFLFLFFLSHPTTQPPTPFPAAASAFLKKLLTPSSLMAFVPKNLFLVGTSGLVGKALTPEILRSKHFTVRILVRPSTRVAQKELFDSYEKEGAIIVEGESRLFIFVLVVCLYTQSPFSYRRCQRRGQAHRASQRV